MAALSDARLVLTARCLPESLQHLPQHADRMRDVPLPVRHRDEVVGSALEQYPPSSRLGRDPGAGGLVMKQQAAHLGYAPHPAQVARIALDQAAEAVHQPGADAAELLGHSACL